MELSIIGALVFILIGCIPKIIEHFRKNHLTECVNWCVTKNDSIHRCNLSLVDYIHNEQRKNNLSGNFALSLYESGPDKELITEILDKYQNELSQKFHAGYLAYGKEIAQMDGEHYFWYTLLSYLSDFERSFIYNGKEMFTETTDFCEYPDDSDDYPIYHVTRHLTEYGLAYQKLLYISYLAVNRRGVIWVADFAMENTKNLIETKELKLTRR